jgi:hypothetical protein
MIKKENSEGWGKNRLNDPKKQNGQRRIKATAKWGEHHPTQNEWTYCDDAILKQSCQPLSSIAREAKKVKMRQWPTISPKTLRRARSSQKKYL